MQKYSIYRIDSGQKEHMFDSDDMNEISVAMKVMCLSLSNYRYHFLECENGFKSGVFLIEKNDNAVINEEDKIKRKKFTENFIMWSRNNIAVMAHMHFLNISF